MQRHAAAVMSVLVSHVSASQYQRFRFAQPRILLCMIHRCACNHPRSLHEMVCFDAGTTSTFFPIIALPCSVWQAPIWQAPVLLGKAMSGHTCEHGRSRAA